jgi:ribose-phosphate pyrophosphokinase
MRLMQNVLQPDILAVIPYFGGRQDRKDKPRVPIGAKLVQLLMQLSNKSNDNGLHADQIQGFFENQ